MNITEQLLKKSFGWMRGDGMTEEAFFARWDRELTEARKAHAEKQRQYRLLYPEKNRASMRASYAKHAERYREGARKKRAQMKNDPVKLSAYRKYCREKTAARLKSDPNFKLRFRLRGRVTMALKRGLCPKSEGTEELLGCSIEVFRRYIESKWLPGMSWENYGRGGWHLDHIIPCNAFDLTKVTERKKCFHYTNCQPLWQTDNLSKGSKVHRQQWLNLTEPL